MYSSKSEKKMTSNYSLTCILKQVTSVAMSEKQGTNLENHTAGNGEDTKPLTLQDITYKYIYTFKFQQAS